MRTIVLSSSLIAFSVACGYAKLLLFPYLFFVELFTVAVFLSGLLAGPAWGLWIGGVARLVFSVANPYGPPHPWILVAQVVGAALVGALGGIARPWLLGASDSPGARRTRVALLLACGFLATLLYDALTNIAQGIAFGSFAVSIALGVLPALQHMASNLVIFALVGNLAIPWLRQHPMAARLRSGGASRLAIAVLLSLGYVPCAARAAGLADAPADTTARSAASPDTTPRAVIAPPDTIRAARSATARPAPPFARRAIDVAAERKVGGGSLEDILPLLRPVFLSPLPLFGPIQGVLALPDGGGPIRLEGVGNAAERATDEPLIGSVELGWGAPWLAFALSDPRTDATETLDLDSLQAVPQPDTFLEPGEALARPEPIGPAFPKADADTARGGSTRTTLVYRRGSGDAQLTGIRFLTSVFRRKLYASYARNQANGWEPLARTRSGRYTVRAELGQAASHRVELEGLLYERSIQDSMIDVPNQVSGASEWDRRHLALRAARYGARSSDRWQVRIGSSKQTWIISPVALSPDAGARERWEFPTIAANGLFSWRPAPTLTWTASVQAASRKVVYRADSLPAFEPRRGDVRVEVGSRYALGPSTGVGIDAAYDARETQTGFLDARASLWRSGGGARGRLDVEFAHERPSWVDLLTPPTLHAFFSPSTSLQTDLSRAGDPGLRPRRLAGALGSLGVTPIRGLDLELSGSYRRVTHDFGWNVGADSVAGVYQVSSLAGERGSGWLSHAALGWEFRRGPIRSRGVGWIRGGPDSLSPQSGSPPRRALDAALQLRAVLFKGDLPLSLGVESHARGPRRGLIREAGRVTWDGALTADFGAAGVYLRVRDVFDQRPGSAIWDPAAPAGAPLPGRTFQAGIAWSLLD